VPHGAQSTVALLSLPQASATAAHYQAAVRLYVSGPVA